MPNPKLVFLDTQVFDQELYDIDSPRLRRLVDLVDQGQAKVLITEITQREIVARIREATKSATSAIKLCRKKREVSILRQLAPSFSELFAKHDHIALSKTIEEKFASYCKHLNAVILPLSLADQSLASIVDDYFETRPPFREGRKRSEFPDAFAGAILKAWCSKENKDVYVVTDDSDWIELCGKDRLSYLPSLIDYFGLFPDSELARELIACLQNASFNSVRDTIAEEFKGLGFVLFNLEGDVEEIDDVDVTFGDIVIVEAADGNAVAEIECDVSFCADVSFETGGIWDPEDEIMLFATQSRGRINDTTVVTAEVAFEYDESDHNARVDVEHVKIDAWDIPVDGDNLAEAEDYDD